MTSCGFTWLQAASGTVEVADDHVCLEVMLPWLLAFLADSAGD
jgi:hypothetical protein